MKENGLKAGLLGLFLTGAVWAQNPAQPPQVNETATPAPTARKKQAGQQKKAANPQRLLQRYDANTDGKIARDEWQGNDKAFTRLDANADGMITREELNALAAHTRQNGFAKLDANGDGKIAREEWHGKEKGFAKLDADGDGFLTANELGKGRNKGKRPSAPPPSSTTKPNV